MIVPTRISSQGYATARESGGSRDSQSIGAIKKSKLKISPENVNPLSRKAIALQVALRMRQRGYKEGFNAKDTVPYIICYEQGNASSASSAGIAERARHPDEVKSDGSRWLVDIDYYLAQQIHPVVSRLCVEIQGTSPEHLAECLGLDPSKYRSKSNDAASSDPSASLLFATSDELA